MTSTWYGHSSCSTRTCEADLHSFPSEMKVTSTSTLLALMLIYVLHSQSVHPDILIFHKISQTITHWLSRARSGMKDAPKLTFLMFFLFAQFLINRNEHLHFSRELLVGGFHYSISKEHQRVEKSMRWKNIFQSNSKQMMASKEN